MLYKEVQRFTQWWLWLILLSIATIPFVGIYQQIILDQPFGDQPMSDGGLVTFAILTLLLLLFFAFIRLTTTITAKEIQINFSPFVNKSIKWEAIEKVEVLDYGFVGGWGIRLFTSYGTVYNIRGRKGLAITLKNGKKILVGTQQPQALSNAVHKIAFKK
jgi:ABC-type multidrug transport system fused ATPase/permease subunit